MENRQKVILVVDDEPHIIELVELDAVDHLTQPFNPGEM